MVLARSGGHDRGCSGLGGGALGVEEVLLSYLWRIAWLSQRREALVRVVRPVLLFVLLAGILLSLAVEPSLVSAQLTPPGAGYADAATGPVPPRRLVIAASGPGLAGRMLAFVLLTAVLAALATFALRWWRGRSMPEA